MHEIRKNLVAWINKAQYTSILRDGQVGIPSNSDISGWWGLALSVNMPPGAPMEDVLFFLD